VAAAPSIWAVLPAAGVGKRMGSDTPKQYLDLLGRPVMHWGLRALLAHEAVSGAVVALNPVDPWWPDKVPEHAKPIRTVTGGIERFESVFNALAHLLTHLPPDTVPESWVLVHDAVRPCVAPEDIDRLLREGMSTPHGALLASPVRDTLKRQGSFGEVAATVPRDGLWQALTPQLFPLQALHKALLRVTEQGLAVTDEAQAMELAGFQPLLVEGQSSNIKITRPADLPLAAAILRALHPGA